MTDSKSCYNSCNKKFGTFDPSRIYCKKGCDSDDDTLAQCKDETCGKVCIKSELGEENSQLGTWSKFFSRAPTDPTLCFTACYYGCNKKPDFGDNSD